MKNPDEQQFELENRSSDELKMFQSVFTLAGIETKGIFKLDNPYWPRHPDYFLVRTPWYLFKTKFGLIEIGWRKRVISITWDDTEIRKIVTSDDITKNENFVHAYSYEKAIEYLKELVKN